MRGYRRGHGDIIKVGVGEKLEIIKKRGPWLRELELSKEKHILYAAYRARNTAKVRSDASVGDVV